MRDFVDWHSARRAAPHSEAPRPRAPAFRWSLLRGIAERGATVLVQQAMGSNVETASPSGRLDDALTRIHQNGCRVLMVVDNQKVVGLLTAANVGELIALEAAGRRAAQTKGRADR